MPTVNVYGEDIEFPDSMSDDDISKAIQTSDSFKQPGSAVPESVKNKPESSNSDLILGGLSRVPGSVGKMLTSEVTDYGPKASGPMIQPPGNYTPESSFHNVVENVKGNLKPVLDTFRHPLQHFAEDPAETAQTLTLPAQLTHPINTTEKINSIAGKVAPVAKAVAREAPDLAKRINVIHPLGLPSELIQSGKNVASDVRNQNLVEKGFPEGTEAPGIKKEVMKFSPSSEPQPYNGGRLKPKNFNPQEEVPPEKWTPYRKKKGIIKG